MKTQLLMPVGRLAVPACMLSACMLFVLSLNPAFADPPATTRVPVTATTGTAGIAGYSGSAGTISHRIVVFSHVPGVMLATGTALSGTNNIALLNAAIAGGNVDVYMDGNSWVETSLVAYSHTHFYGVGGPLLELSNTANCTMALNAHRVAVNLSGTEGFTTVNGVTQNTLTPVVSGTAPWYGDSDITFSDIFWNGNGANQTQVPDRNFPVSGGGGIPNCCIDLCGVDGWKIDRCFFTGGTQFQTYFGNTHNGTIRDSWSWKPTPTATSSEESPEDDAFHFQGSNVDILIDGGGTLYNSDDAIAANPGELLDPTDYSAVPYQNIGNNQYFTVRNFYDNGGTIGTYCITGADANHTAWNLHFLFDGCRFDPVNQYANQFASSVWHFGGGNYDFRWLNTIISGTTRTFSIPPQSYDVSIEGTRIPNYNAAMTGSAVFGVGSIDSLCVKGSIITGTNGTSGTPVGDLIQVGGNSYIGNLNVSGNQLTGLNDVLNNTNGVPGTITTLGGDGNTFSNCGDDLTAGYPATDRLGQFAHTLADERAAAFYSLVYSGSNCVTRTAAITDPVTGFINGLHNLGLWRSCIGVIWRGGFPYPVGTSLPGGGPGSGFTGYVPLFGGLLNGAGALSPQIPGSSTGAFAAQWLVNPNFVTAFPAQLTGSAAKTCVVVFNAMDTSAYRSLAGSYDGSDHDSVFALVIPNGGTLGAYYATASSDTILSSTTPIVSGSTYMACDTWTPTSGTSGNVTLDEFALGGHETETETGAANFNIRSSQQLGWGEAPNLASNPTQISVILWFDAALSATQVNQLEWLLKNTVCSGMGMP